MNMSRPSFGSWIVICDGRKALVLENVGDLKFPHLRLKESYEQPSPATHDQGVSPPGRSHQSLGHNRSAVTQTDWHDEVEHEFLRQLAIRLDEAVVSGEASDIVLVAAPRALGMIRKSYSPAVERAIIREISKDLVKSPIGEIERHVFADAASY
jgi:protein required for attachment to host cells